MKLALHYFDLPTRHPFTISRSTTAVQSTVIVELEQEGLHGYGEAPECDYYGATIPRITAALEQVRAEVEASRLDEPDAFWQQMRPRLAACPFAQCALDVAAHDLWGKLRGAPVWKLWGLSVDRCPLTDYTIGIDAIDVMVSKLEEFAGWPIYKIKLGTRQDLDIVRALRQHTTAPFRVDANCAWGAEEAIGNASALKALGVELIEQPLPPGQWQTMQEVYRQSALPLVADEDCQNEPDVDRCVGHYHGINIKVNKCGGLTPARRMIARARQLGLAVMVGCFTESTVGISGIAQLLPLVDYADTDGALLLAKDPAAGVTIDCGRVHYPPEPGCGVRLL
jgi:L-alanine-DL-glutamate epimerase-like enolase superfamily enzyme